MSTKYCTACGASVSFDASECRYCGEQLAVSQPQYQAPPPPPPQGQPFGQQQYGQPYGQPQYGPPNGQPGYNPYVNYANRKNKIVAGLLGIFLGGLGIHKFYLGRIGWGIVYLLFCWTYIPSIVGFIEGIVYLASNEEKFHMKYSRR